MRLLRAVVGVVIVVALVGACGQSTPPPVKPLRTPKGVDDITGIWRSAQQGTLELRKNGSYVFITPGAALAGDYSLSQDQITFFGDTKECGGSQGTYRMQVSYQDRVLFTEPNDACAVRRTQLTADPFVYGS